MEPGAPQGNRSEVLSALPELLAGRYRVEGALGTGGMGEVYRAWDTLLQRWVAVKRVLQAAQHDPSRSMETLHEARIIARLKHSAIVAVYDVLEQNGEVFLVEELVSGSSLRKKLGAPFEIREFLSFAKECAGALAEASQEGIVHCDLKPENILVTEEGLPKILDFGLARRQFVARASLVAGEEESTGTGSSSSPTIPISEPAFLGGTLNYASPEVLLGQLPDPRADIFSLGIVFYEMLTGKHPFRRDTAAATMVAIVHDRPESPCKVNPELLPAVGALVLRMLEKDRVHRTKGGRELLEELERVGSVVHPPLPLWLRIVLGSAAGALLVLGVLTLRGLFEPTGSLTGGSPPYLAVESFVSLSQDPDDALFALGMTEAVQTRLASLEGLQVVAAESEVGSQVSLEGTLQRSEENLRISYRLVDRKTGVHFAGDIVEGSAADIFRLEDDVTHGIARALSKKFHLISPETPPGSNPPTHDVDAYDYYLQARGYLHRPGDAREAEIAASLFQKAREIDPLFTLAQAGLGEAYWRLHTETKDAAWALRAEDAAMVAARENPELPEVQVTLGTIYLGRGRAGDAKDAFRRALELDPSNFPASLGLARAHEANGDFADAEQTYRASIRARPADWSVHSYLGAFYYRRGALESALQCFQKVVELTPDNARGYSNLGGIYQLLNRPEDAARAYEHSLALKPNARAYSNLATLYRFQGKLEDAARTYEQALSLDSSDYRVWGNLAGVYDMTPGRKAAADSANRRAIELAEAQLSINPNDPEVLAQLAMYQSVTGNRDRALRLIGRAIEARPHAPDIWFRASTVHMALNDRKEALKAVEKALQAGASPEDWRRDPAMASLVADPEFTRLAEQWSDSTRSGR